MMQHRRQKSRAKNHRRANSRKSRSGTILGVEQLEQRNLLSVNVLSYHMDNQSTGLNSAETLLTVANVNTSSFGKTFTTPLDGQGYAEPLYVSGVNITTGTFQGVHNVVYVATEHDGLYAIDSQGGNVLWYDSFINPAISGVALAGATSITTVPNGDTGSSDINPEIGITSTPVIDPTQNAIFILTNTKQMVGSTTHYVANLFKIDIQDGSVIASRIIGDTISNGGNNFTYRTQTDPASLNQDPFVFGNGDGAVSVNGQSRVYFNALRKMSRSGMTIFDGVVTTTWASHGDNFPYHGWVLRFDENTLALVGVLNTTPNGGLGGIWQGAGIAPYDTHLDANGNPILYFETGNGTFDGNYSGGVTTGLNGQGMPNKGDYGDAFVKVVVDTTTTQGNQNINGWGLAVADYFAPSNNQSLNGGDTDLGSGGPIVLPDSVGSAAHPHLLIGAGKQGTIYLIDRDNMGKFDPNNTQTDAVVEEQSELSGVLNQPAFFNGTIYYVPGYGGSAETFSIANGAFSLSPTSSTPDTFGQLIGSPTISANGTANAIMWVADRGSNTLRAYSAANLSDELWTSGEASGGRDTVPGNISKFSVPTVANGQVFLATNSSLVAYGPPVIPTSGPAAPSNPAATGLTYQSVQITWQDNSNNEDYFSIQRSASSSGPFVEIGEASANATSYIDTNNLESETTYYYQVEAHNIYQGGTYSSPTNVVSAMTPSAPPIGTGDGLEGTYWNDRNGNHLTGTPKLVRSRSASELRRQQQFARPRRRRDGVLGAVDGRNPGPILGNLHVLHRERRRRAVVHQAGRRRQLYDGDRQLLRSFADGKHRHVHDVRRPTLRHRDEFLQQRRRLGGATPLVEREHRRNGRPPKPALLRSRSDRSRRADCGRRLGHRGEYRLERQLRQRNRLPPRADQSRQFDHRFHDPPQYDNLSRQ